MNKKMQEILQNFEFEGEVISVVENNQGNINATYVVTTSTGKKYLLQKINTYVFKEPHLVMKNIEFVTNHIRRKLEQQQDSSHQTLTIVPTKDNRNMAVYVNQDGEKEYYRAFLFIDHCISFNTFYECGDKKEQVAFNVGKCFGHFHQLLSDFPISMLSYTIPDFHNTPQRFNNLLASIENNVTNRALSCSQEIVYLISKIKECSIIHNSLGSSIPLRVTHNDTKLNNVLIDETTLEGVAIIDLDTVMPGSLLYDVGDGIRSACSNSFEDETDLSKVFINIDLVKSYLRGYLSEMGSFLTPDEVTYLGQSIRILTYELTLRFLTDYINGDIYFKTRYPEHNKDRYLNQFALLQDIERKLDEIDAFIKAFMETEDFPRNRKKNN